MSFSLLLRRHLEMVQRSLEVSHHGLPLLLGNIEVRMGLYHGAARIHLGATGGPAHHFGDPVLGDDSEKTAHQRRRMAWRPREICYFYP